MGSLDSTSGFDYQSIFVHALPQVAPNPPSNSDITFGGGRFGEMPSWWIRVSHEMLRFCEKVLESETQNSEEPDDEREVFE